MKNWSLSQRLIAGFGVMVAALMVMMVFSLVVARTIKAMDRTSNAMSHMGMSSWMIGVGRGAQARGVPGPLR